LCPIDLTLVDKTLLTQEEVAYLNAYHQKVYDTLAPFLNKKEKQWLAEKTRAIVV